MKMMLTKMMATIAILSTTMKTPMSMGMTLLSQIALTIVMMNMISSSSWVPMITFLTMIGGLMIIFMYMSSITSNEKFKMNVKLMLPMIIMLLVTEEMTMNFPTQEDQIIKNSLNSMISMNKMYSKSAAMTLMMVLYLFLTMISVNKIIKLFEGPLRSKT
uniref:NADH dehydrogenase subunit 6 n=1 Tax=Antialcidas floripennae TaxID=2962403 RepID=UPI002114CC36|nr:NADH dehydrogenase subunit 6 [Antialcidas floripennae]UTI38484.1 NADH dehydrogenase subunit 6 [Antialcidas floripennae]